MTDTQKKLILEHLRGMTFQELMESIETVSDYIVKELDPADSKK